MKNLNSYLSLGLLVSLITASSYSLVSVDKSESSFEANIKSFLYGVDLHAQTDQAEIYSDFIVKQNGDFYTIDFMLTDDGEIEILSKDFEEEYQIMDSYSTTKLKHHTVPIAVPNSGLAFKA